MQNLTCIVCPIGCSLDVDDSRKADDSRETDSGFIVTGNKCKRGAEYALEEIRAPKRVVTATVQVQEDQNDTAENPADHLYKSNSIKRVPVKTAKPCPRENINLLLADIYEAKARLPVKTGDVIIAGWKPKNAAFHGVGIDIIATRSLS